MRALLSLLAVSVIGCGCHSISSPTNPILIAFKSATPIPMVNPLTTDQTKRTWDHTIQLPNGIKARLTASGWIGGRFYVLYSDESDPRIAGSPGDYVYPSEIRIDPNYQLLYGLAQGYRPIGNTPVTLLYVYDLQRRKLLQSYNLKNGLITSP